MTETSKLKKPESVTLESATSGMLPETRPLSVLDDDETTWGPLDRVGEENLTPEQQIMSMKDNLTALIQQLRRDQAEHQLQGRINIEKADLLERVINHLEGIAGFDGNTGEFPMLTPSKLRKTEPRQT